jgi:hypothetical protein
MDSLKKDFYTLLVKLPNGKVIQTSKMSANYSNIESLKIDAAYRSNIPYSRISLYWNDELLYPESLFLHEFEAKGEKFPINQFNVNNLIFLKID